MYITQEDYDILEHAGVKGMRWGVRRQRRISNLQRQSQKGSGKAAGLRAAGRVGLIDIAKGHGVRGGAARKAARWQARTDRITSGKASVGDKLVSVGSTRMSDLVPVRAKNANKKTFTSNDKLVVAGAVGAVFAANLLTKASMRR